MHFHHRCIPHQCHPRPKQRESLTPRIAYSNHTVSAPSPLSQLDGDIATIGISDHAADALGDVVHVDLPEVGEDMDLG